MNLLKIYIFILCASLASTLCLAMESAGEDFSDNRFEEFWQEKFDNKDSQAIFQLIVKFIENYDTIEGKGPGFLAHIFKLWPEKIKFFEEKIGNSQNSYSRSKQLMLEKCFVDSLCLLGKSDKNINAHLDMSYSLGLRSWKVSCQINERKQYEKIVSQAIWYSILGAKSGCNDSYKLLIRIISGESKMRTEYALYYTLLIPFLENKDVQSEKLFIKVALESEDAIKRIETYIRKLRENKNNPNQLEILDDLMQSFRDEKAKKSYNKAMSLWKNSPSEAVNSLLEAEDRCREAKEKLAEIRQSKGYTNYKKAKKDDPARLLRNLDIEIGAELYNNYCERFKEASNNQNYIDPTIYYCLEKAVIRGNAEAIREKKRIEKSKGYTGIYGDLSSTDFEYAFASGYKSVLDMNELVAAHYSKMAAETSTPTTTTSTTTAISTNIRPLGKSQEKSVIRSRPKETKQRNSIAKNIPTPLKSTIATIQASEEDKKSQMPLSQNREEKAEDIKLSPISSPEQKKSEREEKMTKFLTSSFLETSDQAPTQSLEEAPDSRPVHRKNRTLQRTHSLSHCPIGSNTSEERPLITEGKTIKRRRSLSHISTPSQSSKKMSTAVAAPTKNENKNPSTKRTLKTLKLSKKKDKSLKPEGPVKQSSSSTKTSSSLSKSEEQLSKSEGSLSTSKEKMPFSKLIRALNSAQSKKDVKLTVTTITSTLDQLNNVDWRRTGNTISATNKDNSAIHLTIHTHDDPDVLWYNKPEIIKDFLSFVGACNQELLVRIDKIGKK